MNNNSRVVLSAIAALFAISLIVRFVVLSQAGVPGMWIFYLGLPIGGVVTVLLLLLRLGLLNFGEGPRATVQHWQHNTTVQPPQQSSPSWATPSTLRLQELEDLRTSGAISDTEYAAKRAGIISGI
ncbi:MAG: SHOCT domain-containing protein [Mycobacterium sp.]|uniref:SHOCT domain-containing protein n=1 Tax=Mycobacterium sp. TaxID=1785 RepID=UPI003C66B8F8